MIHFHGCPLMSKPNRNSRRRGLQRSPNLGYSSMAEQKLSFPNPVFVDRYLFFRGKAPIQFVVPFTTTSRLAPTIQQSSVVSFSKPEGSQYSTCLFSLVDLSMKEKRCINYREPVLFVGVTYLPPSVTLARSHSFLLGTLSTLRLDCSSGTKNKQDTLLGIPSTSWFLWASRFCPFESYFTADLWVSKSYVSLP